MLSNTDHYFITIVKEGNLHRASQVLYVSQPSLTKYIQRLEKQLGTELFDRSVSPMRLTDAGRLYCDYLMDAQDREQSLRSRLDELARTERGTLRLGIPTYCGQCYLPWVLKIFHERYPHVNIELREDHGEAIERKLADREIDLGILHLPVENQDFLSRELFTETVLLAAPRQSKYEKAESLLDFREEAFIMPHREQKLGKVVTEALGRAQFQPNILLRSENVMTMLSLVSLGMGVGFLPAGGLGSLPERILNTVSFCRLRELAESNWKLIALRRKNCHTPAYTEYFIDLLAAYGKEVNDA